MSKKEIAQFKKAEKMLADIKQARIDAMVRARKSELWIQENTEEYSKINNEFNEVKRDLKEFFNIKRLPLWTHIIVNIKMFIERPIKYLIYSHKFMKETIKIYWKYKKILKEWDDDFDYTEKRINEDYEFVEGSQKHIKEIEGLINRWRNNLTKRLKKKVKRGTKVIL